MASPLALTDSHSAPARMAETAATLNLDQAMRSDSLAGDDRMAETAVTLDLDLAPALTSALQRQSSPRAAKGLELDSIKQASPVGGQASTSHSPGPPAGSSR